MITKLLERYNFTDDHGHKLELCTDYHALLQMAEFKEMAEKTATLSVEVKGESLEEVREKLRAEFKKHLYDDGEAWEERAALRR